MKKEQYQHIEREANGMKLILEFPLESDYSFQIEQDIKKILYSELQSKIKEFYL